MYTYITPLLAANTDFALPILVGGLDVESQTTTKRRTIKNSKVMFFYDKRLSRLVGDELELFIEEQTPYSPQTS